MAVEDMVTELQDAAHLRRQAMELEAEAEQLHSVADPVLLRHTRNTPEGRLLVEGLLVTYVPPGTRTSYPAALLVSLVPADILDKVRKVEVRSEYITVQDLEKVERAGTPTSDGGLNA